MISKKIILPFLLTIILLSGCTTVNPNIEYNEITEIKGYNNDKLNYLLQGVIDLENDKADTRNKPLSTDKQKGTFIYNILNENYMNKYETPEEAPENPYYPILQDSLIPNDGDVHDAVFPIDKEVKVAYKKSDIDKIMNDIIGDTIKDGTKITQDGLILDGDEYLLFTYEYYGSDLIGNKGRATNFEIDSIKQASAKDIEVIARYQDDALENKEDYGIGECNLTYHISEKPNSFYGYTVNEYKYTGCKLDKDYIAPDFPSQLIYGIYEGIYSDYVTLKQYGEDNIKIYKGKDGEPLDLNNDGIKEQFMIGPDNPNGTKVLGINGDKGYNFIYDFEHNIVDDYNELLDGLFVEMYFEDLDGGNDIEIIVAVGDKKTRVEAIFYKIGGEDGFTKLGTIYGKDYLDYDQETMVIHAPYSKNGVCQRYEIADGKINNI